MDFDLWEKEFETANKLNANLVNIVRSIHPLPKNEIPSPALDFCDFLLYRLIKLSVLKRTSVTSADIPMDLIKVVPDRLCFPLAHFLIQ